MANFVIKLKFEDLYIHFNPHTNAYFVGDGMKGAAVFTYENGFKLIEEQKLVAWELLEIHPPKRLLANRATEKELFDKTHKK
jgi:hypothetical protein